MKQLHQKVKELKLRAMPINYSGMSVNGNGDLVPDTDDGIDMKASATDNIIKGYLCVWGVRDTYGTMFVKGCFAKSLQDRGPDSSAKYKVTFLWMHDQRDPIGRFNVLKEDDYGLYFEAEVDTMPSVPNGQRAVDQVRSGTLNQFSIGFDYIWDKVEYDSNTDCLMLLEVELFEGSVVTIGSNSETYACRSIEEYTDVKENLDSETNDLLKFIPRNKHLEFRQLLKRHIALAKVEPQELKAQALIDEKRAAGDSENKLDLSLILKANL